MPMQKWDLSVLPILDVNLKNVELLFQKKWHMSSFLGSVWCLILQNLEQNMDFTKITLVPRGVLNSDTIFFLDLYDADIAKFKTGHGFYKGNFSPKGLIEIRHHFCIPIWPQLRHLTFTNSGDFILTYFIIVLHIVTSSMFQDNLDSVIVSCHGRLEEWSSSKPVFASKVVPALRSFSFILTVISGHLLIFQL